MPVEEAEASRRGRARLAIAIPAYGRAAAIAGSVANMSDQARADGLDVVFHVSDDTPDTSDTCAHICGITHGEHRGCRSQSDARFKRPVDEVKQKLVRFPLSER